eukprot:COSAG01_NODE_7405_length_3220_cov_6.542031_2_plen_229_part_00
MERGDLIARLLQTPAVQLQKPRQGMSGWLSKQSDWLSSWNRRWVVLWPEGRQSRWWLLLYDAPTSSKARRAAPLVTGGFTVTTAGVYASGGDALSHQHQVAAERAYLEVTVGDSTSRTLLPGRKSAAGRVVFRLSHTCAAEVRVWHRALREIAQPGALSPTAKASVAARCTRTQSSVEAAGGVLSRWGSGLAVPGQTQLGYPMARRAPMRSAFCHGRLCVHRLDPCTG